MGDRIAVMSKGVLQQIGTPEELYTNPANTFVAGFIGSPAMNLLPARLLGIGGDGQLAGFRPEHVDSATAARDAAHLRRARRGGRVPRRRAARARRGSATPRSW